MLSSENETEVMQASGIQPYRFAIEVKFGERPAEAMALHHSSVGACRARTGSTLQWSA